VNEIRIGTQGNKLKLRAKSEVYVPEQLGLLDDSPIPLTTATVYSLSNQPTPRKQRDPSARDPS
jgi:PIN domain nuclease of toxin-antitoxin system